MFPWVRFDIDGLEHIPATGPAILVGNHRSYFDGLAIGYVAAQIGRPMRFLGKKEVFDVPLVGQLASALGGIRVERGTGSDEPLAAAAEALDGGELVALMPQGTIPGGRAFFEPVSSAGGGRPGSPRSPRRRSSRWASGGPSRCGPATPSCRTSWRSGTRPPCASGWAGPSS